jgi:diguanylate cyclase (GGDEF)-like protein
MYLVAGESTRYVLGALGNGVAITGVSFGWAASRSLRGIRTPWWKTAAPGALTFAASLIEQPTGNQWPSGAVLLLAMCLVLAFTAWELWKVVGERHTTVASPISPDAWSAIIAISIASTGGAVFYAVRLVAYLTVGADSALYINWLGPALTTMGIALILMVVTYSVAELSRYEIAHHWRIRAIHDDLTGLLNRNEFWEQAHKRLGSGSGDAAVMVADFDRFKEMNDDYGHAAGDRALAAFGGACHLALGANDVAGRMGGDEFVILVGTGGTDRAARIADRLTDIFAAPEIASDTRPTVSYGIAAVQGTDLDSAVELADKALYRAKGEGRNRTAVQS